MRQVRVEVECWNVIEQTELVEVSERCERRDVARAFYQRRAQTPAIPNRNIECLEQRPCIRAESLLTRDQRIAVMFVFDLALLQIISKAHVVMRSEQQAGTLTL